MVKLSKAYISQKPRVDTRGLPEGYDPHYFYEYASQFHHKQAAGLEGLIYRWMPHNLLRSFAFAIDPFKEFKVSMGIVTPINRDIYKVPSSVLDARKSYYSKVYNSDSINITHRPYGSTPNPPVVTKQVSDLSPTQSYYVRVRDTTRRTRLTGSNVGEFELFKAQLLSPSRTGYQRIQTVHAYETDEGVIRGFSEDSYLSQTMTTAGRFTKSSYEALRTSELAACQTLMSQYAVPMYRDILPRKRNYSLFRNIVELRDIPRSILSFRETVRHLSDLEKALPKSLSDAVFSAKSVIKDIPNEYLSFHFGWKQSLSDLVGLVSSPEKISKQLAFLIDRNGKDTTYRTKRTLFVNSASATGIPYDLLRFEPINTVKGVNRLERSYEFRMVVNANFRFPDVDSPILRKKYFWTKMGVSPSPTDIYNLIPWTWLLDWFTGLGNYIELIDDINRDPQLINWGFLTARCEGSLVTDYTASIQNSLGGRYYAPNGFTWDDSYRTIVNHQSRINYTVQLRRSLANIMDVNMTTDPRKLNAYQTSILGALISQRSPFWKGH